MIGIQKCKDQNIENIIFLVVLYGCESWSLVLREGHRLNVFVLRTICGLRAEEGTWDWGKLHVEGFYDLCSSLNIFWVIKSSRMRLGWHVVCVGERRSVYMCTGIW
jgi:hypothetical protein